MQQCTSCFVCQKLQEKIIKTKYQYEVIGMQMITYFHLCRGCQLSRQDISMAQRTFPVLAAERMRSYPVQIKSKCGLSDQITIIFVKHLTLFTPVLSADHL